jgi:hypothetical protein
VTALPSLAALALERAPWHELERALLRGATPDLAALAGWEFRGINHLPLNALPVARLAGIKKFCKGFVRGDDGRLLGYNSSVAQNALDGRWCIAPERFGHYEARAVDPTSRDNAYLHAVLLDYSGGGNARSSPTRNLRDYLVQVEPSDPDLYLGKAFYALGPMRVATSYFILERHRLVTRDAGSHEVTRVERR